MVLYTIYLLKDIETIGAALWKARDCIRLPNSDTSRSEAIKAIDFAINGLQGNHYPISIDQFKVPKTSDKSDEIMSAMKGIVSSAREKDIVVLVVKNERTKEEEEDDIEGL